MGDTKEPGHKDRGPSSGDESNDGELELRVPSRARLIVSPLPIRGANRIEFELPYVVAALRDGRMGKGDKLAGVVRDLTGFGEGAHVVDFGGGPGVITEGLLKLVGQTGRLTYLDASRGMFNEAVNRLDVSNVTMILGDIHTAKSLVDAPADVGLLSGNQHLLTNPKLAFGQMRATLKPGGSLVVITHVLRDSNPLQPGLFSALVDDALGRRPDLLANGLRLPLVTERELDSRVSFIEQCGFAVTRMEDETWPTHANFIFGPFPLRTIRRRLEIICPDEKDLDGLAVKVYDDICRGRIVQICLLCQRVG